MPNQQSNLPSGTGRDARALGLDVSIASVKDAMDAVLATPRADAAIAALEAALSEKDAAGPPAVSARSVLDLLKRYWRTFREQRQRQRLRAALRELSERELMDIGVTSAEIERIAAHRALDGLRDGTAYLWTRSRGVM
jgi:uncharacterized protein YjiS (DUF1127 family)